MGTSAATLVFVNLVEIPLIPSKKSDAEKEERPAFHS
jgi:hypothetical protein